MGWSDRQREVARAIESPDTGVNRPVVVPGPVQSGKSYSGSYAFFAWVARYWSGHDFILASLGQTQMDGVLKKYAASFAAEAGLGWTRKEDHYEMGSALGDAPNRFYCLLGNSAISEGRARGLTVPGFYLTEATLVQQTFIDTLFDRCSVPFALPCMDMNPAGPMHPIKETWIDSGKGCHIPFQIWDNPTMTQEYADSLDDRYGVGTPTWRRMKMGEWAETEGAIYPNAEQAVGDAPPIMDAVKLGIAIDYADSSVTHALLIGHFPDGTRWVLDEWRHDGRVEGKQSAPWQAVEIDKKLIKGRRIHKGVCDTNGRDLMDSLHSLTGIRFKPATHKHERSEGIQKVRQRLESGRLNIDRRCTHLIREMMNYRWEERAGKFGDDVPVKEHDHGCFSADTLVTTREGTFRFDEVPTQGEVRGPDGQWHQYVNAGITRANAPLYRIALAGRDVIRCTPDHRIAMADGTVKRADELEPGDVIASVESVDCQCDEAGVSRTGVLPAREVLRPAVRVGRGSREALASRGLGCECWSDSEWDAYSSRQQESIRQSIREPEPDVGERAYRRAQGRAAFQGEYITAGASCRCEMAQERGGAQVALGARKAPMVKQGVPDTDVRGMRFGIQDVEAKWRQVLPSELQDAGAAVTVESARLEGGRNTVYCLTVPDLGWFALANGVIVKNCDALRYYEWEELGVRNPVKILGIQRGSQRRDFVRLNPFN